jgi:CubicO group peptidase (beta-lactamase class C family)
MSRAVSFRLAALGLALSLVSAPNDLRSRLDAAIPPLMRVGDIPGLSVAVVRDGRLYYSGAFGVRDAATRTAVDRNTVFDAASLTKPVLAYVVLRLADRGVIDLDAPIAALVPDPGLRPDPRIARITPRMLLTHSSGVPNCCGALSLAFDPGTNWTYSGEGFSWLGRLVEQRTGRPLQDVVREEVFQPFAMTHSTMVWNDSLEADGASAHTEWGRPIAARRPPVDRLGIANGCCSLRTTADDYARFVAAMMAGTGLKPATAKAMWTAQVETRHSVGLDAAPATVRDRIAWGLGWGLARGDSGVMFWHWGDAGNAKAFVIGDPRRHEAIVYFANARTGLSIASHVVSIVFPGTSYPLLWLGYGSIDDSARMAERSTVHVALDSGAAAGARRLAMLRALHPDRLTLDQILAAAADLGDEHAVPAADTILAIAERDFPDSAAVLIARGDLRLTAGADPQGAVSYYEHAVALAPTDSVGRARLDWAREDVRAGDHPPTLDDGAVRRFAGVYMGRRVSADGGHLYYADGVTDRHELVALNPDTFELQGDHSFRLRFVAGDSDVASKVIVTGYDGTRVENRRTQ